MFKRIFVCVIVFALAVLTRFYGNDFDNGLFMHPDERAVMFAAGRVHFFSQLNPDFFAYGTLPVYVLKAVARIYTHFAGGSDNDFGLLVRIGRVIASLLDIVTLGLVILLARRIFKAPRPALYAGLFYLFSFFPVQNSNFFIVDNFVNCGLSLLFYWLLRYLEAPKARFAAAAAVTMAAVLASKITPVIYLPLIVLMFFIEARDGKLTFSSRPAPRLLFAGLFLMLLAGFHFLFMPYAWLAFPRFISEVKAQVRMNSDAFTFPYTMLYAGTKPYLYYLENIFRWGVGPVVSVFFFAGFAAAVRNMWRAARRRGVWPWLLTVYMILNLYYFLVIGRSAVKFMRYMLPLYPFIAVMAGCGLDRAARWRETDAARRGYTSRVAAMSLVLAALCLVPFLNIYSSPHTRKQAGGWMEQNIPEGAVLAVEHWDERLPSYPRKRYAYVELPLYDYPDDVAKWRAINRKLARADYIVIASQKLFVPLQRLDDCAKLPRCYPLAKDYYRRLFSGQLGFEKVAEFTSRPRFPFTPKRFEIIDDNADESFSVYDHPRVYIFKKTDPSSL